MNGRAILAAGLLLSAAALQGAGTANRVSRSAQLGGGDTEVESGILNLEGVNGCYILATGSITTYPVGGTVDAGVNLWDDGTYITGYSITAPGDGGTHDFCVVHQVTQPILQEAVGIGVYLDETVGPNALYNFDSDGGFNDVTEVCTGPAPTCGAGVLEVPAVDHTGLAALGLLLGAAATWALIRRRRAA